MILISYACVCVCVCVCVIFKNNESYIHPISPLKTRSRTQTLKIPTPKTFFLIVGHFHFVRLLLASFSCRWLLMKVRSIDRSFSLWSVKGSVSFCFLFRVCVSFTSSFTSSSSSSSLFFLARFFLLFPSKFKSIHQFIKTILAYIPHKIHFLYSCDLRYVSTSNNNTEEHAQRTCAYNTHRLHAPTQF